MLSPDSLRSRYQQVRAVSERICALLEAEDYQIQSIVETSPPKWHLAHVTWFFETFLLKPHLKNYQVFHPKFGLLFNSYYETLGTFHPRPKRGLLARPTVNEVYAYRQAVDEAMTRLFEALEKTPNPQVARFIELGLHHEQQHQELLLMDIKHNFSVNPLKPCYLSDLPHHHVTHTQPLQWHEQAAGLYELGHSDQTQFAYDNESPRHPHYLGAYRLANRLVTNAEYLAFMEDDGYLRADLWLADAWHHLKQHPWRHPLYWEQDDQGHWYEMTLGGLRDLNPHEPVCHVSYYEADAYARWVGKRLPTEAEVEVVVADKPLQGNFFDQGTLHPMPSTQAGQWYGDLWAWTATAYYPYPGFTPFEGSAGEYNGKFMSNQMVLRGGCCATSHNHMRATYRNFFYPQDRWQFSGIRLAENSQ